MRTVDKIRKKILGAATVFPLLFAFGMPVRANVAVRPSAVYFGNQTVGTTSSAITVTLTNDNKHNIIISQVSSSSAQFSISAPSLPITLSPRQTLTVTVQFSPAAAQTYSGTLVFTRKNSWTISIPLSGTGVQAAATTIQLPTITSQPLSKTVTAGQTASFSVAATGTSPMTYQWNKNGAPISGATSSTYMTPAETTADSNAQFTVVVANSAGSATSNAATLTVNAATLVLSSSSSSLNFGNVNVSSSSSQNVTLTNTGNSNVTISSVSISGAGFNASGVSAGLILTPGQTATLTATFNPAVAGSVTGSVAVASNATNSPDTIALSGTGVTVVNHSVALSWSPSTSSVVGYNTYSSTISGGPYTKLTAAPVAVTSYTDSTVQAGITYYYVVTSVDSTNTESAYSTETSAIIP